MDPSPPTPRYRSVDHLAFDDEGGVVVYLRGPRTTHRVSRRQARLLRRCRGFAPLAAHARGSGMDVQAATADLEDLARRGLLETPVQVRRALVARARPRGPRQIDAVVVPTRDRPATVERAVASLVRSTREQDRDLLVLVSDDSADVAVHFEVRERLSALAVRSGASIRLCSRDDRRRYCAALGERTGLAGLVDFALLGHPDLSRAFGANRNALLLETTGQVVLWTDDDVVARLAPCPEPQPGLALGAAADPTAVWTFPDRQAALAGVRPAPLPLHALHERWIGREVGECLAAARGVDLSSSSAGLTRSLATRGGRVVASMTGLVGDCALGSPHLYLTLAGSSRERLHSSGEAYERSLTSRAVFRSATRPVLHRSPFFMATAAAVDHREPVPPFVPVHRNEDGLWGSVVARCLPGALLACLPWAVSHDPPEPRSFSREQARQSAATFRFADLVGSLIATQQLVGEGNTRQAQLGQRLAACGALGPADLEEMVRLVRLRWFGAAIRRLERLLEVHGSQPEWWAEDVREAIRAASSRAGEPPWPDDLSVGRSPEQARELLATLLHRFGGLLEAWPALVQGAAELREDGVRLTLAV